VESVQAILKRCPYFRGVPEEPLAVISAHGRVTPVPRDHVLCEEGTEPDKAWILGKGMVEARMDIGKGQHEVLATMKPGTLFGHISLLDKQARSATLVAVAASDVVQFTSAEFGWLLADRSNAGRFFRRAIILALGDTLLASATHLKEITQKEGEPPPVDNPEVFFKRLRDRLPARR